MKNIFIGNLGEKAACSYLKKHKYNILCKNYKKRYGEIDIIASKTDVVSFIEVKTRKNSDFGRACEAVTKTKQDKIIKTAYTYIAEKKLDCNYSFDVIEIYHENGKIKEIEHIINAFYAN